MLHLPVLRAGVPYRSLNRTVLEHLYRQRAYHEKAQAS